MTPQERLALALQYQKKLGDSLPSTPAENAARPVQEPEQSWLDKLAEAASGAGYGLGQQVEGMGQMIRHPLDTLHSMAVGAGRAMDNPAAAVQSFKESAANAVSSPFNMGQAIGANAPISPSKLAAALESPAVREIVAYHGTPHKFPPTEANPLGEFDASKIGTGEGAQAYGHGIYFAESPSVAKSYQNPNAGSMFLGSRGINVGGKTYSSSGQLRKASNEATDMTEKAMYDILATAQSKGIDGPGKIAKAIKDNPVAWGSWEFGQDAINAAMKRIRKEASFSNQKGSFYHADLPDEMIDRMLDWDKPLSEQPKAFQNAVKELPRYKDPDIFSKTTAGEAYGELSGMIGGRSKASDYLRNIGVPGIKYLDAGSRGQGGTGTRNFVVFPGEEKKVKILERK
jgi:hypothetical protein